MTRREEYTTEAPPKLEVRVPAGRVEIEAGGSGTTTVELEPLGGGSSEEAVESATIELRGPATSPRLVVKVKQPGRFGFRDAQVLVRITAPELSELEASTASADVEARGKLGAARVETASGEVELESVERDATVNVASGDVELGSVGGTAEVNTASGDVRVDGLGGGGRIRTASGDVVVRDAVGTVDVQSASGDQRIDAMRAGSVSLRSASGDLTVGVVRGSSVFLDARSMSGDMSSDIELGEEAPADDGDGPVVEVRAHSMSGDVKVLRA